MTRLQRWVDNLRHARWRTCQLFARRDTSEHVCCMRGEDENGEPIFFMVRHRSPHDEEPAQGPEGGRDSGENS